MFKDSSTHFLTIEKYIGNVFWLKKLFRKYVLGDSQRIHQRTSDTSKNTASITRSTNYIWNTIQNAMSAIRSWFVTSTLEQAETDDIDRVTDLEGLFM